VIAHIARKVPESQAPISSARLYRWSTGEGESRHDPQRLEQRPDPLRRMNAITRSMRSADGISVRSCRAMRGSPGALVRSVVSRSGVSAPAAR